ncbi:MAG: GntR family transcriptional regulator [Thermodesulfobacteriota bacterium]
MLKPYKPGSLVEQLYRTICDAIMDGSLAPGHPLREADLQKHFSVSRAPIREAIRLLEADRLVVVSAYKRKYVRKITREDLLEIIPVLARMEGCAAHLAVRQGSQQEAEELRQINQNLEQAYGRGDISACHELNMNFHRLMVKNARNETLKQAIRPMVKRVVGLWVSTLYLQKPIMFETTIAEHRKIVESFAARDPKAAEENACNHVESLLSRALAASLFDQDGNFLIQGAQ